MNRWIIVAAVLLFSCGGAAKSQDVYYPPASNENYANVLYSDSAEEHGDSEDDTGSVQAEPPKQVADGPDTKVVQKTERKSYEPTADDLEQRLVKTARVQLTVKKESHIAEKIIEFEQITKSVKGYVSSKTERSVTARVPNDRLDEVLKAVRELGKVKDEDISVQDVTSRFVDLRIRVENMRRLKTRLQELIEQGKNVEEVLAVEKELSRVTAQLESLEGQLRLMKNQTTYATISVYIKKRVRPGPIGWVFYGIYSGVKWLFVWD